MADTRGRQAVKITDPTTNANEAGVTAAGAIKVDLEQVLGATLSATNGIFVSAVTGATFSVTNAGTFAVQESGTQVLVDNAGFTDGTSKVVTGGYIFDEVAGTALTENDVAAARIDAKRAQVAVLEDATTRGQRAAVSAGGALSVSLTASSATVTVDTELTAVAALADATANPTITNISSFLMGYNGTTWDRLRSTTANGLAVDVTRVTGTVTVDTELPAAAALADATANPTVPAVGAFNLIQTPGAATWDRVKAVVAAMDSTGTGVQAVGMLAQLDDTATAAVTENQFAPPRLSTRRALLVEGVVSGTNINVALAASSATVTVDTELPAAAALADATANPTTTSVGSLVLLYNGTTWDRARGATTLADALANPGTGLLQDQAFLMGFNGTTWDRVRTGNTGRLQVDVITGGGSNTPTGPTAGYFTKSALAAGSATTTELTTVEAGGAKLWKVDVWASVPFKAELRTVDNAIESANKGIGGGLAATAWQWVSPHPNFITLGSTAGLDAFRVIVTNLDSNTAADVYATFYYAS